MRILGVDLGDARTGIAVCDNDERLGRPLKTLVERDWSILARQISSIAAETGSARIVLGHPINMDGSVGYRAQRSREFAQLLRQVSGLPVVLWDERNTTVSAAYYLNDCNIRGEKRKNLIDQVAAMLILESYLRWRLNHPGEEEPHAAL